MRPQSRRGHGAVVTAALLPPPGPCPELCDLIWCGDLSGADNAGLPSRRHGRDRGRRGPHADALLPHDGRLVSAPTLNRRGWSLKRDAPSPSSAACITPIIGLGKQLDIGRMSQVARTTRTAFAFPTYTRPSASLSRISRRSLASVLSSIIPPAAHDEVEVSFVEGRL